MTQELRNIFISGAIIVKCRVAEFDNLLSLIRQEMPHVKIVYVRNSLGSLEITERGGETVEN